MEIKSSLVITVVIIVVVIWLVLWVICQKPFSEKYRNETSYTPYEGDEYMYMTHLPFGNPPLTNLAETKQLRRIYPDDRIFHKDNLYIGDMFNY